MRAFAKACTRFQTSVRATDAFGSFCETGVTESRYEKKNDKRVLQLTLRGFWTGPALFVRISPNAFLSLCGSRMRWHVFFLRVWLGLQESTSLPQHSE
jgi:hypothetical protein